MLLVLGVVLVYGRRYREELRLEKNIKDNIQTVDDLSESSTLSDPQQLTDFYNPTETAPMFLVEGVNKDNNGLYLFFVWPRAMEQKETDTIISCKPWDILIIDKVTSAKSYVTSRGLLDKVREYSFRKMLFTGLCADSECREINNSCTLYLYDK